MVSLVIVVSFEPYELIMTHFGAFVYPLGSLCRLDPEKDEFKGQCDDQRLPEGY